MTTSKTNDSVMDFMVKWEETCQKAQAFILYPLLTVGPFFVALMPALLTGRSVFYLISQVDYMLVAVVISVVIAFAMEVVNINVIHMAIELTGKNRPWSVFILSCVSIILMASVGTVLYMGERESHELLRYLATASPFFTGSVYLALGLGHEVVKETRNKELERRQLEAQKQETEWTKLKRDYEKELRELEIDKELKLARIEANKTVKLSENTKPTDAGDQVNAMNEARQIAKEERQQIVLDIVTGDPRVGPSKVLGQMKEMGYNVSLSTIKRDIKDLNGLVAK